MTTVARFFERLARRTPVLPADKYTDAHSSIICAPVRIRDEPCIPKDVRRQRGFVAHIAPAEGGDDLGHGLVRYVIRLDHGGILAPLNARQFERVSFPGTGTRG